MKKLRYKDGDKVIAGKMEPPLPPGNKIKAGDVVCILHLCLPGSKDQHYTVEAKDGFVWWFSEKEINHKKTSELKASKNEQ